MKTLFTGQSHTKILGLIWCVFLVRGFFYSAVLPIWEGYDEPYHFAFIQQVARTNRLPVFGTPITREVDASLHVVPLPWMLRLHGIPKPFYTHDDFWKLSPQQREGLEKQFKEIPKGWANEATSEPLPNYETQQPPLYYFLLSGLMRGLQNRSLECRVLLLRFAGIILGSFVIPIGYLVAERTTGSSITALGIVGLAAVVPELFIDISRVANDTPAFLIYTAAIYFAIRAVEKPEQFYNLPIVGLLIGLGLLTKAYFLTALPALTAMLLWCFKQWPKERGRLGLFSVLSAVPIFALAGPWYWHVHRSTGSWSGLQRETLVHHSRLEVIAQIPHVNWIGGLISIVLSHIWFGAWSFLELPKVWYLLFGSIFFLASVGLSRFVISLFRRGREKFPTRESYLVVLVSFYGFFWLGLGYDILLTFVSVGVSSSTGWYMYCLVIAELILTYYGLCCILPDRVGAWILPSLTTAFVVLEGYGLYYLLIPYYTGLIAHENGLGGVNPIRMIDLLHFGFHIVYSRILVNKPEALTPAALCVLWSLNVLGSVWIAFNAWKLIASAASTAPPSAKIPT